MFFKLLALFIIVPLVELFLILQVGKFIGIMPTILIIVFTGTAGITIARRQGYQVINNIRTNLNQGKVPTDDLISAFLILVGGLTLLTPGFLTDVTGFLLILPGPRRIIASFVKKYFIKYLGNSKLNINYQDSNRTNYQEQNYQNDDFIDIEAEEVKSDD
ncbi:FxsA family protein [Halanaerobium salsuginis]|uniref:UPF0716 protein FxsA n=1 Tax=Halanaerobium salsuginis TaxID=29563 RepID=A0A1I4MJ02_9FIRM|nr:FxsA family protein [Halanaerobium salsuginis]SFM03234.1 UPF0716 protein FxsA [Halanaerobium salsuginis]